MEKKNKMRTSLIILVVVLGLFLVFYSLIDCKPNHISFWFILVLGMAIGVALTRFFQGVGNKDKE
jgi:hypothetical protein